MIQVKVRKPHEADVGRRQPDFLEILDQRRPADHLAKARHHAVLAEAHVPHEIAFGMRDEEARGGCFDPHFVEVSRVGKDAEVVDHDAAAVDGVESCLREDLRAKQQRHE